MTCLGGVGLSLFRRQIQVAEWKRSVVHYSEKPQGISNELPAKNSFPADDGMFVIGVRAGGTSYGDAKRRKGGCGRSGGAARRGGAIAGTDGGKYEDAER